MALPPPQRKDFISNFRLKFAEQLDLLTLKMEGGSTAEAFLSDYDVIQRDINQATSVLPPYDLRSCQSQLEKVMSLWRTKHDVGDHAETTGGEAKKAFSFKARKKAVPLKDPVLKATAKVTPSAYESSFVPKNSVQVLDRAEEKICLDSIAIGSDVFLSNIKDCRVEIHSVTGAIQIRSMENTTLLAVPTNGSIFVEECRNCTFVVAPHQLRIHDTSQCRFNVYVTSHPIIEQCNAVTFGQYVVKGQKCAELGVEKMIDDQVGSNRWNEVKDFNWLSDDTSPNVSYMTEGSEDVLELVLP